MKNTSFRRIILILGSVFGTVLLALGLRARRSRGPACYVDTFWWFGWWVRCQGECPAAGQRCVLQSRKKESEEQWGDDTETSKRWSSEMEYRCICR